MLRQQPIACCRLNAHEIDKPSRRIGSGCFGRVFETTFRGKPVAIKLMKHAIDPVFFVNEVDILKNLHHENIPRLYGFLESETKLGIVMQKAIGISLLDYVLLHEMKHGDVLKIGLQIAHTLRYLHNMNIMYRDLKPDNIIIDPVSLKIMLVDFGLAQQLNTSTEKLQGVCGTPGFMAPEVLQGEAYGLASDVYSFGMTMFVVGTCSDPCNPRIMRRRLICVPQSFRKLIMDCLSHEPSSRPPILEIECSLVDMTAMHQESLQQKIRSAFWCIGFCCFSW